MPYFIVQETHPPSIASGEGFVIVGRGTCSTITAYWDFKSAYAALDRIKATCPRAKVVHEGVLSRLDTLAEISKRMEGPE